MKNKKKDNNRKSEVKTEKGAVKTKDRPVYIVQEIDRMGDGCGDSVIGYCDTRKEAEAIAERLEKEQKERLEMWNERCSSCPCNVMNFQSPTSRAAMAELDKVCKSGCPHADGVSVKEMFSIGIGKGKHKDKSIGFGLFCNKRAVVRGDFMYLVSECPKAR